MLCGSVSRSKRALISSVSASVIFLDHHESLFLFLMNVGGHDFMKQSCKILFNLLICVLRSFNDCLCRLR